MLSFFSKFPSSQSSFRNHESQFSTPFCSPFGPVSYLHKRSFVKHDNVQKLAQQLQNLRKKNTESLKLRKAHLVTVSDVKKFSPENLQKVHERIIHFARPHKIDGRWNKPKLSGRKLG